MKWEKAKKTNFELPGVMGEVAVLLAKHAEHSLESVH
jgi:hypothetical protein